MKRILIKNNIWNVSYIVISIFISIFFYSKGTYYAVDSSAYIDNIISELPFYPLTIDLFEIIFRNNAFDMLTTFQIGLALFVIYFFLYTMDVQYNLNYIVKLLIFAILLIPVIKSGNYILTESIGYSLSILFLTIFIKSIIEKKFYFTLYLLLFLLLIYRPQFKLMLIFLFIYFLIQVIFYDRNFKKFIISISLLLIVLFISHFTVAKYNEIYNNQNSYIKFEGTNYITTQLYISNKDTYKIIKNEDLRNSLQIVLENIDKDKSSYKYHNNRCHFALTMKNVRKHFKNEFKTEKYLRQYGDYDNVKKIVAVQLLWENKFRYIQYVLKKAFTVTSLSIVFIFIFFCMSFYGMFKNNDVIFKIVFYISLFSLMNNLLIYAVSRFQFRYLYYSDFILLSIVVIFLYVLIEKYNNQNEEVNEKVNK